MTGLSFTKEEKAIIVRKLQLYFTEELVQELGRFDAEFMLDFIGRRGFAPFGWWRILVGVAGLALLGAS
jgi:uncharacterized protein (DUF2164 family)